MLNETRRFWFFRALFSPNWEKKMPPADSGAWMPRNAAAAQRRAHWPASKVAERKRTAFLRPCKMPDSAVPSAGSAAINQILTERYPKMVAAARTDSQDFIVK